MWTRQVGTKSIQSATGATAARGSVYVVGHTAGPLLGQTNAGVQDAFLLKLPVEPARDITTSTPPELKPNPALGLATTESKTAQTPLPVAPATPRPPDAGAPAAEPPAGGSCAPSQGSKAGADWLLIVLSVPGLLLFRRKESNP